MKRIPSFFAALALTATLSTAAEPAPPPFLGLMEIRGLDYLTNGIATLSSALEMPDHTDFIRTSLLNYLGSPTGLGLDLTRNARFCLFAANSSQHFIPCIVLPTSDENAATYLEVISRNWDPCPPPTDEEEPLPPGLFHFEAPAHYTVIPQKRHVILIIDNLDPHLALSIRDTLNALPPIVPVQGDVAFWIQNPAATLATLIKSISPTADVDSLDAIPANPITAQYLASCNDISFGIAVDNQHLSIQNCASFRPDSPIATALAKRPPITPAANALNLPGALAVIAYSSLAPDATNAALLPSALFDKVRQKFSASDIDVQNLLPKTKPLIEQLRAEFNQIDHLFMQCRGACASFALLPPSDTAHLRFLAYLQLHDPAPFRAEFDRAIHAINQTLASSNTLPLLLSSSTQNTTNIQRLTLNPNWRLTTNPAFNVTPFLRLLRNAPLEIAWNPDGVLFSTAGPDTTACVLAAANAGDVQPLSDSPTFRTLFPSPPTTSPYEIAYIALSDLLRAFIPRLLALPAVGDKLSPDMTYALTAFPPPPGLLAWECHLDGSVAIGTFRVSIDDLSHFFAYATDISLAPTSSPAPPLDDDDDDNNDDPSPHAE